MMWANHYTQSFDGDSGLGSNYNYVVEIPPIATGGVYIRLGLRGPSSGQSRVQEMWLGHGAGYSFDGNQVQITVGGLTSFTLTNGVTYSDPILSSSFGFDTTKRLNLAYSLLSGDNYRRNLGLPSTYVLNWKSGSGDSGTTMKTGYTNASGRTALLDSVQFVDVLPVEPDPVPPPTEYKTEDYMQVLNGERHSSGGIVEGEPGKHLHIQFRNPPGTGKIGFLYEIELTPDADTVVELASYNEAIGSTFPKCNLMFAAGPGSMEARYSQQSSKLGNFHSIHKLKGGERSIINLDVPLVGLTAGRGVVVVFHSQNVGATVNVQWREVAA